MLPNRYTSPLFMLSRWRKLAREGHIVTKGIELDQTISAELKELREVKRRYERLQLEDEVRFLPPTHI